MPNVDTPDAPRMKELLSGLVGYASENPPGREAEVALYLTAILKELGFDVYSPELSPGRCNGVARLDNSDGPTLGFNSHLDVVPAGQGWTGDPSGSSSETGGSLAAAPAMQRARLSPWW